MYYQNKEKVIKCKSKCPRASVHPLFKSTKTIFVLVRLHTGCIGLIKSTMAHCSNFCGECIRSYIPEEASMTVIPRSKNTHDPWHAWPAKRSAAEGPRSLTVAWMSARIDSCVKHMPAHTCSKACKESTVRSLREERSDDDNAMEWKWKRRVMQALSLDSIPMEHCLLPASCPVVMAIASTASELLVYKYHQRQAESVRLSLHVASIPPKCQFSWNQTRRDIVHHGETNECRAGEQPRRFCRVRLRERGKNNLKSGHSSIFPVCGTWEIWSVTLQPESH